MTLEDEIFQKLSEGSGEALEQLIELYYEDIFKYCLWHMPNRSLAEDAVQETFLKTVQYFDRYVHRGKFRAFLYKIAANTCIDLKRKKWPSEEVPDWITKVERGYEEAEAEYDFLQLVKGFDEETKEMLLLRYGQELTIREVASVMGMPMRTVQSRLRKALKDLKYEIQKGENRK